MCLEKLKEANIDMNYNSIKVNGEEKCVFKYLNVEVFPSLVFLDFNIIMKMQKAQRENLGYFLRVFDFSVTQISILVYEALRLLQESKSLEIF